MSSLLTTFVTPQPNSTLIRLLEPVNRVLNLRGIPLLRDTPFMRRLLGVRGSTDIREIDFPAADLARLRAVANPDTAVFLAPNHPEFFTDWMVDKEVLASLDITPGCWATHRVVNGMGKCGQRFWLANNLIAQIPGRCGAAGKAHSIALAKRGDGVLLHPEGTVHWVADQVGPLYPGVLDMATRASKELADAGSDRPVYIAPLIYKYMFLRDETQNLRRALAYVETALDLPSGEAEGDLARRLRAIYLHLTDQVTARHGITLSDGTFWSRQADLISELSYRLATVLDAEPSAEGDPYMRAEAVLKQFDRERRTANLPQGAGQLADDLRGLLGLQPWMYPGETMTQEQIAERIQRLRLDRLRRRLRDRMHAFIPRPVGPRRAHIRLADPFRITSSGPGVSVESLRAHMQTGLDALNVELTASQMGQVYPNPFLD